MVLNSASVTFLKICYYGRQWELIWCNDTCNEQQNIVVGKIALLHRDVTFSRRYVESRSPWSHHKYIHINAGRHEAVWWVQNPV